MLALADLENLGEVEVKEHIANNYAGTVSGFDYGEPTVGDVAELADRLMDYDLLIAYEHVGNWGCDSSSFFLLRHRADGTYHVIHGDHCSCFGFEGQGDIEDTDLAYLKSDRFYFSTGGYDEDDAKHTAAVTAAIAKLED